MNSIPAQEIKRRGLAAVDDLIEKGDVHVIRNNKPQYVVITEERYQTLVAAEALPGAGAGLSGGPDGRPGAEIHNG